MFIISINWLLCGDFFIIIVGSLLVWVGGFKRVFRYLMLFFLFVDGLLLVRINRFFWVWVCFVNKLFKIDCWLEILGEFVVIVWGFLFVM